MPAWDSMSTMVTALKLVRVNGVVIAGHRGGFAGVTDEIEFYPDLGYVLVRWP